MSHVNQPRPRSGGRAPGSKEIGVLDKPKTWALSPSDFAFLWDECARCFYKKVVLKQPRPRTPFPKVFSMIDGAMKDFYVGERAEALAVGAPTGVIGSPDRWVKSAPLTVPACASQLVIRGRLDALVACDDDTVGVIDFKTAEPSGSHIATYSRQLHAYGMSLERPSSGRGTTVSSLGLLCFSPDEYEASEKRAALLGEVTWIEVPRNDDAFQAFLRKVALVLENPEPPEAAVGCVWCGMGPDKRLAA